MPHEVRVRVGDRLITGWKSYRIETDMLTPADGFSLTLGPATREVYELVPPDAEVEVQIDGTTVLSGLIDERSGSVGRGGSGISISGRDRTGRLVDESADLQVFGALDLLSLADELARPTFPDGAVLSNAQNRDLARGRRSGKAPARSEPIFSAQAEAPKKVEPGETRWDVLAQFLEPAKLLAWSEASGRRLVVGLPNYRQDAQWRFLVASPGSPQAHRANVLDARVSESVADAYSVVRLFGARRGDDDSAADDVIRTSAVAQDGPGAGGTGRLFRTRKQLILGDDDVKSLRDARERASRELALRLAESLTLELEVKGHAQALGPRQVPAIYAIDTMAEVALEPFGIAGRFLITAAVFEGRAREAQRSRLTLVPEGTLLTL